MTFVYVASGRAAALALKISREEWEQAYGDPDRRLRERIAELEAALLRAEEALHNAESYARSQAEVFKDHKLAAYRVRDK